MNNTQTLIATLEGAPDIIISLVREVPPQNLKLSPQPQQMVRSRTETRHPASCPCLPHIYYSVLIMFRQLLVHEMLHAYRIEELMLKKGWE